MYIVFKKMKFLYYYVPSKEDRYKSNTYANKYSLI